jgi:hypothetical protein
MPLTDGYSMVDRRSWSQENGPEVLKRLSILTGGGCCAQRWTGTLYPYGWGVLD